MRVLRGPNIDLQRNECDMRDCYSCKPIYFSYFEFQKHAMLCSSFETSEIICDTTQSSFIEELISFGKRDVRASDQDYEQIVPSQGDLTDALFDWWYSQEASFGCSEFLNLDMKPAKSPPSYDEHISSVHHTDAYARTASPTGSEVSVLHSESDFSVTDEPVDASSSLLNDIMECIKTVDKEEITPNVHPDKHTGIHYILNDICSK